MSCAHSCCDFAGMAGRAYVYVCTFDMFVCVFGCCLHRTSASLSSAVQLKRADYYRTAEYYRRSQLWNSSVRVLSAEIADRGKPKCLCCCVNCIETLTRATRAMSTEIVHGFRESPTRNAKYLYTCISIYTVIPVVI